MLEVWGPQGSFKGIYKGLGFLQLKGSIRLQRFRVPLKGSIRFRDPLNGLLMEPLWSLIVGMQGILEGSWGSE